MKQHHIFLIILLSVLTGCTSGLGNQDEAPIGACSKQMSFLVSQVDKLREDQTKLVSPRSIKNSGEIKMVPSDDWTSGFFAGELWYMYELTGDDIWMSKAREYTELLEKEQFNGNDHDIGFRIGCSYGNGYRITSDSTYRKVLIQAAKTLCTRFNEEVGCIKSWDKRKWGFPVIIDNLMNLELLFKAYKETGDTIFRHVAVSHAKKTMQNHFRKDYSSFHVVDYDTLTGGVLSQVTHQGFSDESAWARGQAWGLYGYTMAYRETGITDFLEHAQKIAEFIISHPRLPKDFVPYWDFDAPGIPGEPRDASSAAVIASALYELSGYIEEGSKYLSFADQIMKSLYSGAYLAKYEHNGGFLLMHSTGNKPKKSEINVPIAYADYYFLEAMARRRKLNR